MSVFKDLVAQLVQEYDLVAKDVGRLLHEYSQLQDHSSEHEKKYGALEKRNAQLEKQLSGLQEELRQARSSAKGNVGPGPALPGSSAEIYRASAGITCDVGVQAELAETNGTRRPLAAGRFATNLSSGSGAHVGSSLLGGGSQRLTAAGGSRFASLVKKHKEKREDDTETNPGLDLGSTIGSSQSAERGEKFAAWAKKARERAAERYKDEAEVTKTKAASLASDAAHAATPGIQGKYIDISIYDVKGLNREVLESAQHCQVVARLGFEQQRISWQPLYESGMALPGQIDSIDDASGSCLLTASWGQPDVGARMRFPLEEGDDELEVELEVFAEGLPNRIGYCAVPLDSGKQTWELQGSGGFLNCQVQIGTALAAATKQHVEPEGAFYDWEEFVSRPENQDRAKHLKKVFRVLDEDQHVQVIMADDLLQVLKGSSRSMHFTRPLTLHTLADAIQELRYIYTKVTSSEPPAQADSTISFVVFMRLMLISDLSSYASPESAAFIFSIQSVVLSNDALKSAALTGFLSQFATTEGPEEDNAPTKYRGQNVILFVNFCSSLSVFLSFALLGAALDNDPGASHWAMIEVVFAAVFVGEIITKISVWGNHRFWKGSDRWWNWLDVGLTVVAVFDVLLNFMPFSLGGSGNMILILRGLRLARIARLAKLMRVPILAELANLISGVVISLPWLIWVLVLLFVVIYIAALAARSLLSSISKSAAECGVAGGIDLDNAAVADIEAAGCKLHYLYFDAYCGDVFTCMNTIFRCMIGDCSTTGGRSLAMLLSDGFGLRWMIFYSVSMTITIFCLFNIFTAMFVEAVLSGLKYNDTQRKYAKLSEHAYVKGKLKELVKKVGEVTRNRRCENGSQEAKQALFHRSSSSLGKAGMLNARQGEANDIDETLGSSSELKVNEAEFNYLLRHNSIKKLLEELDIVVEPRSGVFDAFNTDSEGFVVMSDMMSGLLRLRGELQKTDMVASQNTLANIQRRVSEIQASSLQAQAKMIAILEEALVH
eukprot:TRINITY_DN7773_c0_g2_i1.p1 TRINITY_DN7773_c0_g2~~TRINITY_DN7773_c0_g2_i1.p1  ORF type:complete len:1004 (+),score=216.96 TRINITY_DN7773_c0_g2_i1:88-3099(+)